MSGIKDSILGHIALTKTELALVDDSHMQRLRHIRQFGFTSLVYPGANHTRFEHSLGTMQVTRELTSQVSNLRNEELECAGLLHDIGHAAFSHNSDGLVKKYLKTNHEKLGGEIIRKTSIRDVLQDSSMSFNKILGYFAGKGEGEVVTGPFGSDRIDYLVRDSHYSGVTYGIIDYQNIRDKFTLYKGKPAVFEQAASSVENFLLARYSMFTTIYDHHAAVIAEAMYERAVENAFESGEMAPVELKSLNDWQMTARLSSIKESRELISRLLERKLFKRVFVGYVKKEPRINGIENAIEKLGLSKDDYAIKLRRLKVDGSNITILSKEGKLVGKLSEISPLVQTLTKTMNERKKLVVACDRKNVPKVRAAIAKLI